MAKFKCYKESDGGRITVIDTVRTLEKAIDICVGEISNDWPKEVEEARQALSLRRYYGCGYSSVQYNIEEID